MPAKSPEALERKRLRKNAARRRATQIANAPVRRSLQQSDLPRYKVAARMLLGKAPDMSKADMRAMLTEAVRNT